MLLTVNQFRGELPKVHPRQLPPGYAEIAQGIKLDRGIIYARQQSTLVSTIPANIPGIFYRDPEGVFRTQPPTSSVARGQVDQSRLYLTTPAGPRLLVTSPAFSFVELAVPGPTQQPEVEITQGLGGALNDALGGAIGLGDEALAFAYTFVTSLGEESAPSPLSELVINPGTGTLVDMTNLQAAPGGNPRNITSKRIYISKTSATGITDLFFWKEIPESTTSLTNEVLKTTLFEEVIRSRNFDVPPDDLQGIVAMPNGMMAGFTENRLRFCEPFQPHAWPLAYELVTEYGIVGLVAFGSVLAVLTEGQPYIAQGTTPEAVVLTRMEVNLPCVSAESIVDLGYAAVYASHHGLVSISQGGAELVSANLYTSQQWGDLNPSSIRASQYEQKYIFTYNNGSEETRIMDLSGAEPYLIRETLDTGGGYLYDITDGFLYYRRANGQIVRFAEDVALSPYLWRSKLIDMAAPVSMGCALIEADVEAGQTVELDVIANGAVLHTITNPNVVERLPDNLSEQWQIELRGTATVTAVHIAGTPDELKGVIA